MPEGGCFCNKVRYSFTGEPAMKVLSSSHSPNSKPHSKSSHYFVYPRANPHPSSLQALCHCRDCHKISGSTYSTNLAVPEDGFKILTGSPKSISKTADSGNEITSYFCGDCGSTMWRDGASFPGLKIVKAGTLDEVDQLEGAKPGVELFEPRRVGWVQAIPGTEGKATMT